MTQLQIRVRCRCPFSRLQRGRRNILSETGNVTDQLVKQLQDGYKLAAPPDVILQAVYPDDAEDVETDWFWVIPEEYESDMAVSGVQITLEVKTPPMENEEAEKLKGELETSGTFNTKDYEFDWTILGVKKTYTKDSTDEDKPSSPFFRKVVSDASEDTEKYKVDIEFMWTSNLYVPKNEMTDTLRHTFVRTTDRMVEELVMLDKFTDDIRDALKLRDLSISTYTEIDLPKEHTRLANIWDEGRWVFESSDPIDENELWEVLHDGLRKDKAAFKCDGYDGDFVVRV